MKRRIGYKLGPATKAAAENGDAEPAHALPSMPTTVHVRSGTLAEVQPRHPVDILSAHWLHSQTKCRYCGK